MKYVLAVFLLLPGVVIADDFTDSIQVEVDATKQFARDVLNAAQFEQGQATIWQRTQLIDAYAETAGIGQGIHALAGIIADRNLQPADQEYIDNVIPLGAKAEVNLQILNDRILDVLFSIY